MRWVVLSDIHVKFAENLKTPELREKLISYLEEDRKKNGTYDFVLILGDVMYKYNKDGSEQYIEQLLSACGIEKEQLFICPGNHDVNRRDEKRNQIIDTARKEQGGPFPIFEDEYIGYDRFNTIYYKILGREYEHYAVYPSKGQSKFRIINIDSCLLSKDKEDEKKLRVCSPKLFSINNDIKNDDYLNIVIMHHSCNWLTSQDSKDFQHWLADHNIDIVFCGHEHDAGALTLEETVKKGAEKKLMQFICGPVLYENTTTPSIYICNYENDCKIQINMHIFREDGTWGEGQGKMRGFQNGICNYIIPRNVKNVDSAMDDTRLNNEVNQKLMPIKTYPNILKAYPDIADDLRESSFLKFYGLRGKTFTGGAEMNEITAALHEIKDIKKQFLISYPFSEFVRERLKNLPECSDEGKCEEKWKTDFEKIKDLQREYENNSEIRFHNTGLIFRLIFTEKHLYMGYYEKNKNSKDTVMYCFENSTPTYDTYHAYFDYLWIKAKRSLPAIPPKYSFLKEKFSVVPSLVINVCSICNMSCKYCPEGGENLKKIECQQYASNLELKSLIKVFYSHVIEDKGEPVLRITGGEPLLDETMTSRTIQILTAAKGYKKIVLCTNGINLKEAIQNHKSEWIEIRKSLLLKISLDTLNPEVFKNITGSSRLEDIKSNICYARKEGFKIELNLVATKEAVRDKSDILKVFDFARENRLVGLKILTVNDFGGNVKIEQAEEDIAFISRILTDVIEEMKRREYEEVNLYLNDNKGIQMRRFIAVSAKDERCTLTIVDHHNDASSITPRRTFSTFCEKCDYYPDSDRVRKGDVKPCATGIMSLTMRADGVLSPCRLCLDEKKTINGLSNRKIEGLVNSILKEFDQCFHKTIDNGRKRNEKI